MACLGCHFESGSGPSTTPEANTGSRSSALRARIRRSSTMAKNPGCQAELTRHRRNGSLSLRLSTGGTLHSMKPGMSTAPF